MKDEKTGKRLILGAAAGLVFNLGPMNFIVYSEWRFLIVTIDSGRYFNESHLSIRNG